MAFDRTNQADLTALKTERETDPISMGYPANDNQFIRVINDPAANVGGETVARTFDALAMLDALDFDELDAPQTNTKAAEMTHVIAEVAAYEDVSAYKTKWRGMFAANSSTVAALDAQTRVLSRAEVLFGEGTELVVEDWIAARDNG